MSILPRRSPAPFMKLATALGVAGFASHLSGQEIQVAPPTTAPAVVQAWLAPFSVPEYDPNLTDAQQADATPALQSAINYAIANHIPVVQLHANAIYWLKDQPTPATNISSVTSITLWGSVTLDGNGATIHDHHTTLGTPGSTFTIWGLMYGTKYPVTSFYGGSDMHGNNYAGTQNKMVQGAGIMNLHIVHDVQVPYLNTLAVQYADHTTLKNITIDQCPQAAYAVSVTLNGYPHYPTADYVNHPSTPNITDPSIPKAGYVTEWNVGLGQYVTTHYPDVAPSPSVTNLLLEDCSSNGSLREAFRFKEYEGSPSMYASGSCTTFLNARMLRCTSTGVRSTLLQGAGSDQEVNSIKGHIWYRGLSEFDPSGDPAGRDSSKFCGLQVDQCTFDNSAQIVSTINAKNLVITGSQILGGLFIDTGTQTHTVRDNLLLMDNYIAGIASTFKGLNHAMVFRNHVMNYTPTWCTVTGGTDINVLQNYGDGQW